MLVVQLRERVGVAVGNGIDEGRTLGFRIGGMNGLTGQGDRHSHRRVAIVRNVSMKARLSSGHGSDTFMRSIVTTLAQGQSVVRISAEDEIRDVPFEFTPPVGGVTRNHDDIARGDSPAHPAFDTGTPQACRIGG